MTRSTAAGFLTGAVAASVLVGGVTYAAAATSTPTPSAAAPASAAPSSAAPSNAAGAASGRKSRRAVPLAARAEHGSFTVATKRGPATVLVQRGTVTAVTQPSGSTPGRVTVVSPDSFTATYALPADARVRAVATKGTGGKAATTTVRTGERVRLVARGTGTPVPVTTVRVLPARRAAAAKPAASAAAGTATGS